MVNQTVDLAHNG